MNSHQGLCPWTSAGGLRGPRAPANWEYAQLMLTPSNSRYNFGFAMGNHSVHYCPDLAPSDFHLFGPLKRHLGGMAFETEDDLVSELRNWFDNLDVDFFRVGINSLLSRWQKCIDLHGDYVEK
ncbi:histone-lysine N-methyltransferase SETMAR [Plakobranchus ocellatus]|uniref:Histone-lysine N-methyltransferase SETMAR n=1 Tax=Plakobranchus ocellatus TaxID=259542 RepID=A0AAV4DNB9_9GAST|nr:histone-lysine N-methyltransferase SETMAR [Plakobranchus ocellatus]